MFCNSCGNELIDAVRFCRSCGGKVVSQSSQQMCSVEREMVKLGQVSESNKECHLFLTSARVLVVRHDSHTNAAAFGFGLVGAVIAESAKAVSVNKLSKMSPAELLSSRKENYSISCSTIGRVVAKKPRFFSPGCLRFHLNTTVNGQSMKEYTLAGADFEKCIQLLRSVFGDRVEVVDK